MSGDGSRNGRAPRGEQRGGAGRRGAGGKDPEQQVPPTELLERERRLRPLAGRMAIAAGVLPLIGFALTQISVSSIDVASGRLLSGPRAIFDRAGGDPDGQGWLAAYYVQLGQNAALPIVGAIVSALGLLALAFVAHVVIGAIEGRRARPVGGLRVVVPLGIGAYAVVEGLRQVLERLRYREVASVPGSDYGRVRDVVENAAPPALQAALLVTIMLFFLGLAWMNLQAITAGLFTRFLGLIGVFTAIVVLLGGLFGPQLQLDQYGILRAFWAIALGVLLLGRWPRAQPPAWETGEARPWPTRAQMLEEIERERARQKRESEGDEDDDDAPAPRRPQGGRRGRKR